MIAERSRRANWDWPQVLLLQDTRTWLTSGTRSSATDALGKATRLTSRVYPVSSTSAGVCMSGMDGRSVKPGVVSHTVA